MKRLLLGLSLVIAAWMLSPTPQAEAWSWSNNGQKTYKGDKGHKTYKGHKGHKGYKGRKGHKKGRAGVPELDPSAAGGAIVLLLGGVAYIASRRREEEVA